jgi:HAD superfamily hydrolase (TIGR01509 family)
MKKGAIFDMDGLMFDTEQMYQSGWSELAKEQGVALPEGFKKEIGGTAGEDLLNILRKYYPGKDPVLLLRWVQNSVHEQLLAEIPVKPGLHELLDYFKENGVRLAIASSSPEKVIRSNLEVSGLTDYFDEIVSAQGMKHGKPNPDIFLLAAERLCLDPKDCYVLEDAVNGVKAGLAAGCETIMVPDLVEPDEEIRRLAHVCASLSEVKEKISSGAF